MSTCTISNPNYSLALVSKYSCTEFDKVSKSKIRSTPIMLIPTGDFEALEVCKAEFKVIRHPFLSGYHFTRIHAIDNCKSVSFIPHQPIVQSKTDADVKIVSFSMNNVNHNDNNMTCSSSIPTISSSMERQMMQNTELFSGGTFYVLNSDYTFYENSDNKFLVTNKNDTLKLHTISGLCAQGTCAKVCYSSQFINSIPIYNLTALGITPPEFCKPGFLNINVNQDGCYRGSNFDDSFNITASKATIISHKGSDTFVINEVENSSIVINDFEPGVDRLNLTTFTSARKIRSLNVTENPTSINLPGNQTLSFLNVSKNQITVPNLGLTDITINDEETFENLSLNDSSDGSNYSYLAFIAIPVTVCALSIIGAAGFFAYKYFSSRSEKYEAPQDAVATTTGMVVHQAMEVIRQSPSEQDRAPLVPVRMPEPSISPPHSPTHSGYHSPSPFERHSPRGEATLSSEQRTDVHSPPQYPSDGSPLPAPVLSATVPGATVDGSDF